MASHVVLQQPARRIISLAPDITEILFAIGAGEQVVGTVGGDFPLAAQKILRVGTYTGLDREAMLALQPDLIISWHGAFRRELSFFRSMNIPIYVTHPEQLSDVARTIRNIGCLTDHSKKADTLANQLLKETNQLKEIYQRKKRMKVFYQIGNSLFTINQHSWINQIIELCGGQNIFRNNRFVAAAVNLEEVIIANPEMIISDGNKSWSRSSQIFRGTRAFQSHFLFHINPDLTERAGPRLIDGAKQVCIMIDKAR